MPATGVHTFSLISKFYEISKYRDSIIELIHPKNRIGRV
jgi:hypothetical protein